MSNKSDTLYSFSAIFSTNVSHFLYQISLYYNIPLMPTSIGQLGYPLQIQLENTTVILERNWGLREKKSTLELTYNHFLMNSIIHHFINTSIISYYTI